MVISLAGISKRFRTWIFKDLWYRFESDIIYGIAGSNGSGKSTLLQILSGFMTPTTGELTYTRGSTKLLPDEFNSTISYAAPYVSLVEELTVREAIEFQNRCRSRSRQLSAEQVLIQAEMEGVQDRYLNQLSSGMMQRIKLAMAIMSSSEVLLLDEPTSFLDEKSRQWFEKQLEKHRKNRLIVIATNDPKDIGLCAEVLDVEQFSSAS